MNSRFVPITVAIVSISIALFLVFYFDSLWRWIIVSPLLVFVAWPCVKISLFSSQKDIDEVTGVNKLPENNGSSERDPIWGKLNDGQLLSLQEGFMELYLAEGLEQYTDRDQLSIETLESIQAMANKVADKVLVSPALIPVVVHQYIDADHMLRVGSRENWVSFMTTRPNIAPSPESYVGHINETYFEGKL